MSINLLQHKDDLLKAYNAVIDPKNETNWALFTYDGNSNTLKVLDTGDGGLDEIGNNFNSGKVMYALCQITEPTTGLPKLMLIHWQGEGVGTSRLGSCASHIYEVQKFFKGVHLTHSARNEDDVEPDALMSAVKKVSYGAKVIPTSQPSKEPSYVGSVYQRVNPGRDINTSERDKFWSMAEKEEASRIEEEKRRVSTEKQRVDDEKRRLQERLTDECQKDIAEVKRKSIGGTSESLRKERLQEVKDVIKPTSNLKAMWEQKSNIPTPELPKSPVTATDDVVVRSVVKKAWPPMPSRESFEQPDDQRLSSENGSKLSSPVSPKAFSPTIRSPVGTETEHEKPTRNGSHIHNLPSTYHEDVTPPAMSPPPTVDTSYQHQAPFKTSLPPRMPDSDEEQEQDWDAPPLEDEPVVPVAPISPRRSTGDFEVKNPSLGRQAKAMWDYEAGDETEITFDPGDIITHIEFIDDGWWSGRGPDGKFGLFPSNYVELLD